MAYSAVVVRLLVSAPSDITEDDKATIAATITTWNVREGESHGVTFVPMDWSAHAATQYGIPQDAINEQLVDLADVVLALFWHRIGSPTGTAVSGTVEELERAASRGRYVGVLRCERPTNPSSIDSDQLARLESFFVENRQSFLMKTYADEADLLREVQSFLFVAAGRAAADPDLSPAAVMSSRATIWATTTHLGNGHFSLRIMNDGERPAYDVTFAMEVAPGDDGELPDVYGPSAPIPVLGPHKHLEFTVRSWGSVADLVNVTARWADEPGGEQREQVSTVGF